MYVLVVVSLFHLAQNTHTAGRLHLQASKPTHKISKIKKMSSSYGKSIIELIQDRSRVFHERVRMRVSRPLNNKIADILNAKRDTPEYSKVVHELTSFAEETRPFVHESVLSLMSEFLELKREHGSSIEKMIYDQMSVAAFATRLFTHR